MYPNRFDHDDALCLLWHHDEKLTCDERDGLSIIAGAYACNDRAEGRTVKAGVRALREYNSTAAFRLAPPG